MVGPPECPACAPKPLRYEEVTLPGPRPPGTQLIEGPGNTRPKVCEACGRLYTPAVEVIQLVRYADEWPAQDG
jgi:hypothetical protein